MDGGAWWAAVHGVTWSRTRLSDFTFTFHFHALEKAMATHSSVLAWRIPGTEEPGGLLSMGSHRVGHDWSDLAAAAAAAAAAAEFNRRWSIWTLFKRGKTTDILLSSLIQNQKHKFSINEGTNILKGFPKLWRSAGGGHGNPLQYSCLENPHGQRAMVHGVTKSRTWLRN